MDGPDALALPFGDDPTYSVGELNAAIADALRAGLPTSVWVRGEVSHFRVSGNGHAYFDVIEKDGRRDGVRAVLNVALFRMDRQNVNRALRDAGVALADGVEVRIRGRVELYSPTGRLQLIMTAIDPVFTVGRLAANRARLLQVLADEGLLRANAAHPLPMVPLRIGLVTSGGSAAYHDFVHELEASPYAFRVALCAVRVQGAAADRRVAYALRQLVTLDLDVVVVARGGGSRADLAAFDSEVVARAIAAMPVPVLTGIGHVVDRSVADEVAHTVAKTPTAAAAMLVDRVAEFDHTLQAITHRVVARAGSACDGARHRVDRLRHRAVARGRAGTRDAQRSLAARQQSILAAARRGTRDALRRVDAHDVRLRALDPRRVLERGYSITRDADGAVIRATAAVTPDAVLVTEVADGTITSRVERIERVEQAEERG
jgi:exodeoxyribonuclease VII large subunit